MKCKTHSSPRFSCSQCSPFRKMGLLMNLNSKKYQVPEKTCQSHSKYPRSANCTRCSMDRAKLLKKQKAFNRQLKKAQINQLMKGIGEIRQEQVIRLYRN